MSGDRCLQGTPRYKIQLVEEDELSLFDIGLLSRHPRPYPGCRAFEIQLRMSYTKSSFGQTNAPSRLSNMRTQI